MNKPEERCERCYKSVPVTVNENGFDTIGRGRIGNYRQTERQKFHLFYDDLPRMRPYRAEVFERVGGTGVQIWSQFTAMILVITKILVYLNMQAFRQFLWEMLRKTEREFGPGSHPVNALFSAQCRVRNFEIAYEQNYGRI